MELEVWDLICNVTKKQLWEQLRLLWYTDIDHVLCITEPENWIHVSGAVYMLSK